MNFTRQQIQAIWFIIGLLAIATAYHYISFYLFPPAAPDFQTMDQNFIQLRDSILNQNIPDSTDQPKNNEMEKVHLTSNRNEKVININTAGINELTTLPRIGPKIAQRIIDYREKNGPFRDPKDLLNVRGIGKKTFENLQAKITVENP